ncbi:MAG: glycosyltransferase, partial [Thermodesulfobacteriota bacterium]
MISVVICTFNRKEYLEKAIESIVNQTLNPELFELIIVNNNSSDGTGELVNKKFSALPFKLKYIIEKEQGLSACRNTGFRNATFKYIAYIDDDGTASENWLENILLLIESVNDKDFAGAGGHVFPIWEIPIPWWLVPGIQQYYSVFNLADKQFILSVKSKRTLPGCNIFYLKSVLEKYGGFNTKLGRNTDKLISGEETFLNKAIINDGYKLIYEPNIQIKHHIPRSRIKFSWLLSRSFWGGYSNFYMNYLENNLNFINNIKIFINSI